MWLGQEERLDGFGTGRVMCTMKKQSATLSTQQMPHDNHSKSSQTQQSFIPLLIQQVSAR